jgi:hypothetical protein
MNQNRQCVSSRKNISFLAFDKRQTGQSRTRSIDRDIMIIGHACDVRNVKICVSHWEEGFPTNVANDGRAPSLRILRYQCL